MAPIAVGMSLQDYAVPLSIDTILSIEQGQFALYEHLPFLFCSGFSLLKQPVPAYAPL